MNFKKIKNTQYFKKINYYLILDNNLNYYLILDNNLNY